MAVLNPNKIGLAFGVIIGGWHLLWAALVAVVLVGATALTGYVMGGAFGLVWNWVVGASPERPARR